MLDQSLFICYSTDNYSKLTNLCLNSLQEINVKNIKHMKDELDVSNKKLDLDLIYGIIVLEIK